MKNKEVVKSYWDLVAKSMERLKKAKSSWRFDPDSKGPVTLTIDGDDATFSWVEEGGYDSGAYLNSHDVPAIILDCSIAEFEATDNQRFADEQAESAASSAAYENRRNAEDWARYLSLQEKFKDGPPSHDAQKAFAEYQKQQSESQRQIQEHMRYTFQFLQKGIGGPTP